jgi:hypothetical protein
MLQISFEESGIINIGRMSLGTPILLSALFQIITTLEKCLQKGNRVIETQGRENVLFRLCDVDKKREIIKNREHSKKIEESSRGGMNIICSPH